MSDLVLKSVKVIEFSGKKTDCPVWLRKFKAFATTRLFKDILLGKVTVPDDSVTIDPSTEDGKKLLKLREKNKEAYMTLVMCCMDNVCLGAVDAARTEKFVEGNAKLVWENLLEMFKPKTMSNKTALIKEFTNSKLTDMTRNPDTWMDELVYIRQKLRDVSVNKMDDEIVMHVLNNLPEEYNMLVQVLEYQMNSTLTT